MLVKVTQVPNQDHSHPKSKISNTSACQFELLPQSSNAIPSPQRGPKIKGRCDGNADVSLRLLLFTHQAGLNRQRTAALTQGPHRFQTQPRTAEDITSPRVPLSDFAGQELPLPRVSHMAHYLYPSSSNLPYSGRIPMADFSTESSLGH